MALIRYNNPFKELEEMQNQLNKLFDESLTSTARSGLTTPTADVYMNEDEDKLIVEAHLPGYEQDDVELQIENGALIIRADRQERKEQDEKRKYILRESSSSYYRRIGLPKNVEADKIMANFDNGVLEVNVPFKELPKPQTVKIEGKKKK
ncbi:MAG: Hsp20/alpha crystallin family protein [Candidatus Saccharimonadales bacterium]